MSQEIKIRRQIRELNRELAECTANKCEEIRTKLMALFTELRAVTAAC